MATFTISDFSTVLVNVGGENLGPDGLRLQFTVTGTNSVVIKQNTAAPGFANSYTNVAYLNQSLVLQSAGTAVTGSGLVYIPLASCGYDLYVTNTWTSGSVVITTAPANIGGGSGPVGNIPAGDITAGTFGANSGETGDYAVPDDFTVADVLTAGSVSATTTIAAGTTVTAGTALVSTTTTTVGTTLQTNGTTAALVQSATTADVNIGSGTGSGATTTSIRGAAGQVRDLQWKTATTARWVGRANATAESGSDAGSDFELLARTDAGAAIDAPLTIIRATGGAIYTAAGRSISFGGAPAAAATVTRNRRAVTAIPNNTATTVATITIPNAAHSAAIRFTVVGSLGAGGAIGANEASAANSYFVTIARTAGVNAVGAISSAFGAAASAVAGAATVTSVLTLAAVSGAVGATNTIPVQVTIARSGGSSTNHTALVTWEVMNANATGVTVA